MSIESGNPHEQYANWKAPSSESTESTENREIKTPAEAAQEAANRYWEFQSPFAKKIKELENEMRSLSPDSDDYKKAGEQRRFLTEQILSEWSKLTEAARVLEASQEDWSRAPFEISVASQNLYNAKRNAENLMSQPDWMFANDNTVVSVSGLSEEQAKQIETKFGIDKIWNSGGDKTLRGFDERFVAGSKENLIGDSRSQNQVWEALQRQTNSNIMRSKEGHLYLPKSFVE